MAARKDKDTDAPTPEEDMATALLLKEADEALRQEKMEAVWKEWGTTIIGMAVMLVIGTIAGVTYKNWRVGAEQAGTGALVVAESAGIDGLTGLAAERNDIYGGMAALLAAGRIAGEAGDTPDEEALQFLLSAYEMADKADMPEGPSLIAQWGVLRTRASLAQSPDERIDLAAQMERLADKVDTAYAPLILAEAAAIYGENGAYDRAMESIERAKQSPLAEDVPELGTLLQSLEDVYAVRAQQNREIEE